MAEYVSITKTDKTGIYEEIIPQIRNLIEGEPDLIANLANISSVLKLSFVKISWVGFYLLKNGELVLGPFQGNPACVRISFGRGVCGTAAKEERTIIVPNVHEIPNHIFCDPDSKSEIVVPIRKGNQFFGVLDVDSDSFDSFDKIDQEYLERIVELIIPAFLASEEK